MPGVTVPAVVFDLDGVLVDSEPARERATAAYLGEHGVSLDRATWQAALGRRVSDFSVTLAELLGRPPEEVHRELTERYRELTDSGAGLQPMPYLVESLDRLGRAGARLAVASSGTRRYVTRALDALTIRERFDAVVCAEDVRQGKPDPEIYLVAADRLAVRPAQCVAVEDAPNGVAAAQAAGMLAIAVPDTATSAADFHAADAVATDLRAAVDLLLAGLPTRLARR